MPLRSPDRGERAAARRLALTLALLLLAGCGGADGAAPGADAGLTADAAADTGPGPDGTQDAPNVPDAPTAPDAVDAAADAVPDAAAIPDTVPDAAVPDAGLDTAPDAALDARSDAVPDAVPDAAPDTGPPWPPDAGPPTLRVTVNRIPPAMNGSVPYLGPDRPDTAFRLRVPPARFTVDVAAVPPPGGGPPLDWATLIVTLSVTTPDGSGGWSTEAWDEGPAFVVAADGTAAAWQAPEDAPLPEGPLTITAFGTDVLGRAAVAGGLGVDVGPLPAHLDPFPAPDPWLVTFSRDRFALTLVENVDGSYGLEAEPVPGGNGIPDFDEAFLAMGLFSENEEVTAAVRARLVARIREVANGIFGLAADGSPPPDGVPLRLWFEGDPGAPDPAEGAGEAYSLIAVGGDGEPDDIADRIVGRAWIDPNNQSREDDGAYGLGVFTTQIVRMVLANPAGCLLLRDISPIVGTPLGMDPGDAPLLAPDFDLATATQRQRMRYALLTLAIDTGGLATAVTLAHEMGHSLGLVPPGPPPRGLFSQLAGLPFVDSESAGWHIDTPGLNVMQTGSQTNWIEAASGVPRFNELNLAYLRRRLVVDPGAAKSGGALTAPGCGCAAPPGGPAPPAAPPVARYPVMDLITP